MCDLKRTLDAGGHCVLEMPSGTGKTVSLLSLIVAYQQFYPEHRKLIYCSRTMSEIEKALAELKALMKYRADQLGFEEDFRGLGLTSRKNLCLHPSVKREKSGSVVDARCRSLTAGFVKEKKERGEDVDLCIYHDNLDLLEPHNLVPSCVFTLDGMLKYGEKHKQCPYFSVRRMVGGMILLILLPTDRVRCRYAMSLYIPIITYWIQKSQNGLAKNYQKIVLSYLTKPIILTTFA